MGLLANFKIRTKVLIALLPLAIMVIIAVLYSSYRMSTIDARYRSLFDKEVKALHSLTLAQAHNNRFGLFLYKEIAELDKDRMRVIDDDLEQAIVAFHSAMDEAKRESPLILSSVDDGICGLNPEGMTAFVNTADAQMLGFAPEEFVGQPMHALVHHSHADGSPFPREECSMYQTVQDGKHRLVSDEVFWRKGGSWFPVPNDSQLRS